MELRTRRIQTEEVPAQEEASDSRKHRRSKIREFTVDVKHRERQRMRCIIEGGLSEGSSSIKYEVEDDEDEGHDSEISLEPESNVEGDNLDRVGSG